VSDVLVINGSTINLVTSNAWLETLIPYKKGGIPELHFSKWVGKLAALPDSWSGKSCTLTMGGTLVFTGDVQGYIDRYHPDLGWLREYRALGLLNRAAYIPVTDSTTLTDTSNWNLPFDDPNFVASRAGQNIGQIVGDLLTMGVNASALNASGIGAFISTSPWTLPTLTTNDLANLTVIPPYRISINGERFLQSLEQAVQACHPNHWLHIQPDGTIRFYDLRAAANNTLTLGSDPRLDMPTLTRDFSDSYSQVEVRGNTLAQGIILQTQPWTGSSSSDGGLQEDFAWGSYSNSAAKSNWSSACWNQPMQNGQASDYGSCTCPDTNHITCTSSVSTSAYPLNYWNQSSTGVLGWVVAYGDTLGGLGTQIYQARVTASTAQSGAGGTFTLTLDRPLPNINYNSYQLWGLTQNCNLVWRKYKISNTAIGQALMPFFPYPVPFRSASGNAATMTSTALGQVLYSSGGSPPYNIATVGVTLDPVAGLVYFDKPTYLINNAVPSNVQVFVPVATGALQAWAPSSSTYSGTLYTVEGIQRTKIMTVLDWKDYSNQLNMNTFANEYLTSVNNVVVEGTMPYHGLPATTYLAPGQAVSIAGNGYTTGFESVALPIVGLEVHFQNGPNGTSYETAFHLSNRRGRFSPANFIRPSIKPFDFGQGTTIGATGLAQGSMAAVSGETTYSEDANAAVSAGRQQQAEDVADQDQNRHYQRPGRGLLGTRQEVLPTMPRMQKRREETQKEKLSRTVGTEAKEQARIAREAASRPEQDPMRAYRGSDEPGLAEQDPRRGSDQPEGAPDLADVWEGKANDQGAGS
jgi:hypothetical protein